MILAELPNPLGGVLWNSLRNIDVWAGASRRGGRKVFAPLAAQDRVRDLEQLSMPPALEQPLHRVAALLAAPRAAQHKQIADACGAIAAWAEEADLLGTALAFAQLVVTVYPGDANAAFNAGRLARRRAEGARAESWYWYAIREARRQEDWRSYTCGWLGLGNLRIDRGSLPSARRAQLHALRAARRHRLRSEEGAALHNLFTIAAIRGRIHSAQRFALAAAKAYGPVHDRLPVLVKDLAFLWTENGCFAQALQVYRAVEHLIRGSSERLLLVSGMARAAAGAGEWEEYERTRYAALAMLRSCEARERVAAAWLNLARAATSAGDWGSAARWATEASDAAVTTADHKARLDAEAVLDQVRRRLAFAATQVKDRTASDATRTAEQLSRVIAGVT